MRNCWQCALANLCCVQCAVRAVNSALDAAFKVPLVAAVPTASHPSRESCRMDGNLWTVAYFLCCRHNGLQSLQQLSSHSLHFILQLQKNKKAHKIVAIKASAGYLIYIYMPMHSMLPISQVSRYFDRTASHPPCWQCATMTRSLIKTAKIQPLNHPTGESWPGCKSFETLGGDKTKSAGNCTAETALLRICHWIPPSPSRVFPYIPT